MNVRLWAGVVAGALLVGCGVGSQRERGGAAETGSSTEAALGLSPVAPWIADFSSNAGLYFQDLQKDPSTSELVVLFAAQGTVTVGGVTYQGTDQAPVSIVVKLSPQGGVLWSKQLATGSYYSVPIRAAAVGANHEVWLAGRTESPQVLEGRTLDGSFLIRLTGQGALAEVAALDTAELPVRLVVESSGSQVIAFRSNSYGGAVTLRKYDAAHHRLWEHGSGLSGGNQEHADGLSVASDGRIFFHVTNGGDFPGAPDDAAWWFLSPSGAQLGAVSTTGNGAIYGSAVLPDGTFAMVGNYSWESYRKNGSSSGLSRGLNWGIADITGTDNNELLAAGSFGPVAQDSDYRIITGEDPNKYLVLATYSWRGEFLAARRVPAELNVSKVIAMPGGSAAVGGYSFSQAGDWHIQVRVLAVPTAGSSTAYSPPQ